MKNRFLTMLGIILITVTLSHAQKSHAQNGSIADEWEATPQYKEYLTYMEAGDLKSAMKIKKEKVDTITLRVMKPYLSNFKEKYREKYAQRICDNLPIQLTELLNESFFTAQDILNLSDTKEKNLLAQDFYNFFIKYYDENGNAWKYANKITKKFPKLKNTELMNTLEIMAKESDTEANKTPEEKEKEYQEYMKSLDRKIAEENQKQAEEKKKQAEEKKKQAEWDEIIKKLKIMDKSLKK